MTHPRPPIFTLFSFHPVSLFYLVVTLPCSSFNAPHMLWHIDFRRHLGHLVIHCWVNLLGHRKWS